MSFFFIAALYSRYVCAQKIPFTNLHTEIMLQQRLRQIFYHVFRDFNSFKAQQTYAVNSFAHDGSLSLLYKVYQYWVSLYTSTIAQNMQQQAYPEIPIKLFACNLIRYLATIVRNILIIKMWGKIAQLFTFCYIQ